ncbi:MAG: reverse transcriptase domain-containing protein [archaeon]
MKDVGNIYLELCSWKNLVLAWQKAKQGKTKRRYVKRFQKNLRKNLSKLREELVNQTYEPCSLKVFVHRDPKTRKISKAAFRDRVVHNILCNIIVPIFQKDFVYDSHANQLGKGTLKAVERFDKFKRKVSKNNTRECYVLKADIKHYFEEIAHEILVGILRRRIKDERILWLIKKILSVGYVNLRFQREIINGMPLGNLTSQFFANVYLHELDFFVKYKLRASYYIRYVDDFVILHDSKEQLEKWKLEINYFLKERLKIELHPNKSHVLNLRRGINFLGFRIFYYHKLVRKSNLKNFERKFNNLKILFGEGLIGRGEALEFLEGWLAYCSHANTYKYRRHLVKEFNRYFSHGNRIFIHNKKKYENYVRRVRESELEFATQKTLFYYRKGENIREIAEKQGIKEATVWGHLINLIEYGQLSVWEVLPRDKVYEITKKIYSHKEMLKDVKKRFRDSSVTYDEIACVMASIKSKRWRRKKKE